MPSEASRLLADRGVTLVSLDLDDTLVDTDAAAEARIEAAVARAREVVPGLDAALARDALVSAIAANPVTQGRISVFLATLGIDAASNEGIAIRAAYNAVLIDALEWMEGARDVMALLRERYRLAIVTNGPTEMQWPKVRKFGLDDLVDHVVVSGDLGVHKPDPAIFAHLLADAGVEAPRAAHVGDSIHSDVAGARAAGMVAIWYPPRLREHDEVGAHVPDATIERLSDLLE
ncbi:MAG: HAD family hydrolase [Dehalococcoidia bacterium]